jgi:hypothetical protein
MDVMLHAYLLVYVMPMMALLAEMVTVEEDQILQVQMVDLVEVVFLVMGIVIMLEVENFIHPGHLLCLQIIMVFIEAPPILLIKEVLG